MNELPTDALRLWRHIYGDTDQLMAVWSGKRERPDPKAIIPESTIKTDWFRWPREADQALAKVAEHDAAGREVFHCAHLLQVTRRKKNCAADVLALYAEIDQDHETIPVDFVPTAIVASGTPGHVHAYWRLTRAIPPKQAEILNKAMVAACRADGSGWDLTQILRPPGTHNHKSDPPADVELRYLDDEAAYDPDDLTARLGDHVTAAREALAPTCAPTSAAPRAGTDTARDAATVAVLVDAWPQTDAERAACSRHKDLLMPAAGYLVRRTAAEHVLHLLLAVVAQAEPRSDRGWRGEVQRIVEHSAAMLQAGRKVTGGGVLGAHRPQCVAMLRRIWDDPPRQWEIPGAPDQDGAPSDPGGAWVPRAWLDKERADHEHTRALLHDLRIGQESLLAENRALRAAQPAQLAERLARQVGDLECDRTTRGNLVPLLTLWSAHQAQPDKPIAWCSKQQAKAAGWEQNEKRMATVVRRLEESGLIYRETHKRGTQRGDYRTRQEIQLAPELRDCNLPDFLGVAYRRLKAPPKPRAPFRTKLKAPCMCNADRCPTNPEHALVATVARTCPTCNIQVTAPHDHAPQVPVNRTVIPMVQHRRAATADLAARATDGENLRQSSTYVSDGENLRQSAAPPAVDGGLIHDAAEAADRLADALQLGLLPPAENVTQRFRLLEVVGGILHTHGRAPTVADLAEGCLYCHQPLGASDFVVHERCPAVGVAS